VWFQKYIHIPSTKEIGNSEGVGCGGEKPWKFQRMVGLNDQFGFQMPFHSIWIQVSLLLFKNRSCCSKIDLSCEK